MGFSVFIWLIQSGKLGFGGEIKSLLLSGEGGPLAVDEVVELEFFDLFSHLR